VRISGIHPFVHNLFALRLNRFARSGVGTYRRPLSLDKNLNVEREKSMLNSALGSIGISREVMNMIGAQNNSMFRSGIEEVYFGVRHVLDDPVIVNQWEFASVFIQSSRHRLQLNAPPFVLFQLI
jgi:hypothetical protein